MEFKKGGKNARFTGRERYQRKIEGTISASQCAKKGRQGDRVDWEKLIS